MKKDSKQRLFEVMSRLDKTFKPKLNESTDQDRYEDVVFMQGEEADEPLQILNTQGEDAALNYLKQWHEYGSHMGSNELGHGSDDETYEKDGYIMSWNPRIGYIGLQYDLSNMNEMKTTDDNNFDFDDPKHGQDAEAMFKSNLKGFDKNYQPQDRVNRPTQKNTFKKSGDGESELKEGRKDINPKYTHFALLKDTKKFVNGWDFADVDPEDLKQDKMHYFFQDIIDMDIEPKNVVIGTARKFQREGLNPFDSNNWYKFNTDGWEEKDDLNEMYPPPFNSVDSNLKRNTPEYEEELKKHYAKYGYKSDGRTKLDDLDDTEYDVVYKMIDELNKIVAILEEYEKKSGRNLGYAISHIEEGIDELRTPSRE